MCVCARARVSQGGGGKNTSHSFSSRIALNAPPYTHSNYQIHASMKASTVLAFCNELAEPGDVNQGVGAPPQIGYGKIGP